MKSLYCLQLESCVFVKKDNLAKRHFLQSHSDDRHDTGNSAKIYRIFIESIISFMKDIVNQSSVALLYSEIFITSDKSLFISSCTRELSPCKVHSVAI